MGDSDLTMFGKVINRLPAQNVARVALALRTPDYLVPERTALIV